MEMIIFLANEKGSDESRNWDRADMYDLDLRHEIMSVCFVRFPALYKL
jgi:hypothetical protein